MMMRIGLLSDSHGRAATTSKAVRLLIERGAEVIVHLGDVGSLEVIDALIERVDRNGKLTPEVHVVFGNVDWDADSLGRYAASLGVKVDDPMGRLDTGDQSVVFLHGHEDSVMDQAMAQGADFLCHGHTHRTRNELIGSTRVINPGALFRASDYTVAILDTNSADVQFFSVRES